MSVPGSLTPEGYARARRALMRRDPVLGAAIKRIGPCGMADRQRKDHLSALAGAIVSQQLSTKGRRDDLRQVCRALSGQPYPGRGGNRGARAT